MILTFKDHTINLDRFRNATQVELDVTDKLKILLHYTDDAKITKELPKWVHEQFFIENDDANNCLILHPRTNKFAGHFYCKDCGALVNPATDDLASIVHLQCGSCSED